MIHYVAVHARRDRGKSDTLYKGRWHIELLFRWIKQHLKLRKFLGNIRL